MNDFCNWLFDEKNKHSTVFAHNAAGYDNKFVIKWCLEKCLPPNTYIRQGNRITLMTFKKFNLRFIDSYHFFLQPLKGLSKTYGLDTVKGYFPHHFNRPENQNYIGPIPPMEQFGHLNMMNSTGEDDYEGSYECFLAWYDEQKGSTWDFKEQMALYCEADVVLLAKAILKFRKIFKDKLDVDPWRYSTIASLRMDIYMNVN